ncbi:protein GRAVITROPIC IN THE LIGHT 1-like [Curcuma longa]|uniref:protein GRAVITROPIC IN THE LIGHT 1-like n=1 Tax=Curcuma longa TaxID=136217 RepID=UPI003D9F7FBB
MESYRPEPWTFSKILHLRRPSASSAGCACSTPDEDAYSIHKIKLSQNFSGKSILAQANGFCKDKHEKQHESLFLKEKDSMESLLANLFASISVVKAFYAQLQLSESPYNPDMIQSSDLAIVAEFKRVSELKQAYCKNRLVIPHLACDPNIAVAAQIKEKHNLIKTYRITIDKLKADLKLKDSERFSLQAELLEVEKNNRALDLKLHPGRSISALDDLHPSGLNPTHFLTILRCAFKSIRTFVKLMENEMESVGWDLNAAAITIQPDVFGWRKPGHRIFAYESYVCSKMFSNFHTKNFNLDASEDRLQWSSHEFFQEFNQLRYVEQIKTLSQHSAIASFFKAKYLELVHPKMEESFFGNLDHRAVLSSGQGFPNSVFFSHFVEMARRVWLLHCLFFSFKQDSDRHIFQVQRGNRFSEVYMESVVDDNDGRRPTMVGFTVVPGFKVCSMLIQCKVFLSPADPCS